MISLIGRSCALKPKAVDAVAIAAFQLLQVTFTMAGSLVGKK